MMQKILEQTRAKLAPYIGIEEKPVQNTGGESFAYMPNIERANLIRKIPKQNYENLSRMVPINWL